MRFVSWMGALALLILPAAAAKAEEKEQPKKEELEPGLVAEIFDVGEAIENFPTIPADKKPAVKRVDKEVNVGSTGDAWPGTALTDHFYIRWTGVIKIPKDGKYRFFTESDDGSRLYIDGKLVVDNGGLHGMEEKESEEIELKAGNHEIRIEMFENEGDAGCKASWSGEGIEKAVIPASVLFHKKGAEKDKEEKKEEKKE
jgi:hypothetical protein